MKLTKPQQELLKWFHGIGPCSLFDRPGDGRRALRVAEKLEALGLVKKVDAFLYRRTPAGDALVAEWSKAHG